MPVCLNGACDNLVPAMKYKGVRKLPLANLKVSRRYGTESEVIFITDLYPHPVLMGTSKIHFGTALAAVAATQNVMQIMDQNG